LGVAYHSKLQSLATVTPSKDINMSANCATWTSERIELLKRCLHAGLSCGQTAREIGVTRNAVIGKMNRLGLSRPPAGRLRLSFAGGFVTGIQGDYAWKATDTRSGSQACRCPATPARF